MSSFGTWETVDGLPAFGYLADPRTHPAAPWDPMFGMPTTRHWVGLGSRRVQMIADNEGGVGLWDTADGARWITPLSSTKTAADNSRRPAPWRFRVHAGK